MSPEEANRRNEILQAAIRVFAEQGFDKASIKAIAAEAGLKSPSLIYWYFKNKEELLLAVMAYLSPLVQRAENPAAVMDMLPEDFLRMFAQGYFAIFTNPNAPRLLRIFLSEAIRSRNMVDLVAPRMLPVLYFIIAYLQHQVERGRLRPHDSPTAARAFIGSLLVYMIGKEILTPLGEGLPNTNAYTEEIIRLFLDGLRP